MIAAAANQRSNPLSAVNQDDLIDEVETDTRHALQMSAMFYDRGASMATDARTVQKSSLPFVVIGAQFMVATTLLFVLLLNYMHRPISTNYRVEFAKFVASPIQLYVPAFMLPFALRLVGLFKNTRNHNYKQIAIPSHCRLLISDDGALGDSFGSIAHLARHKDSYLYASLATFFSVIQSFCTTQTPQPRYQSVFRTITVDWSAEAFVAAAAVARYAFVNPGAALVAVGAAIAGAFTAAGTAISQEMYVFLFSLSIGGFAWTQPDLRRRARNLLSGMLHYLPDYSHAPNDAFTSFAGVETIDDLLGVYMELTKACKLSGVEMVPISLDDITDRPVAFTVAVKYILNTAATDLHAIAANSSEAAMEAIRVARIGELEDYKCAIFPQLSEGEDADGINFITKRQADAESIFSCQTIYNAAILYADENACYFPNVIAADEHFALAAHRATANNLALAAANSRRFPVPGASAHFHGRVVTRHLKEEIARKISTDLMSKRLTDHNIETDL